MDNTGERLAGSERIHQVYSTLHVFAGLLPNDVRVITSQAVGPPLPDTLDDGTVVWAVSFDVAISDQTTHRP